ncbi:NADH:flavin oxidoreductase [Shewanella khirikhana]|uniref:NADH:flavin oxidoreductase n=1 Tax=Shewanella khirikhana TaxID=1965282 RepID=UPI0030CAD908
MCQALNSGFEFARAGVRLKNRAVLAPLTHNMSDADGNPSQAELDWLEHCAKGGFGLLIAAATQVWPGGRCWAGQPALMTDHQQQAFSRFARAAKANDALALVQLHHGGVRAAPALNGTAPVGPGAEAPGGRYPLGVNELDEAGIEQLIAAFIASAERAYQAGLDGVELHAAHHFLLCNFLNPMLNRRSDRWGGSLENRARLLIEIIHGIRQRLPRSFLLGVRLSPESYASVEGIELDHQLEVADLLATADIDYVHFSMGDSFKQACGKETALLGEVTNALIGKTVLMFAGNIRDGAAAQQVLDAGGDLVAIGTAAIGNPDWVHRVSSDTPLLTPPFAATLLHGYGFTEAGLAYLGAIPGLVAPSEQQG